MYVSRRINLLFCVLKHLMILVRYANPNTIFYRNYLLTIIVDFSTVGFGSALVLKIDMSGVMYLII